MAIMTTAARTSPVAAETLARTARRSTSGLRHARAKSQRRPWALVGGHDVRAVFRKAAFRFVFREPLRRSAEPSQRGGRVYLRQARREEAKPGSTAPPASGCGAGFGATLRQRIHVVGCHRNDGGVARGRCSMNCRSRARDARGRFGILDERRPGGPASAQQAKCLAGKTTCLAKKTTGLLKCEALASFSLGFITMAARDS